MSEWISVDDQLPRCAWPLSEVGDWVIIFYDLWAEVVLACRVWIDEDEWAWKDSAGTEYESLYVAHWMPLPEPPK